MDSVNEASCEIECPMQLSRWYRFVNWLLPPEPIGDAWFHLHDKVPAGGDMIHSTITVRFDFAGLCRLALLGRGCEVQLRVITKEPVNTIESHSRVVIG